MPGSPRRSRVAASLVLAVCLAGAVACGDRDEEAQPAAESGSGADLLAGVAPAALPEYVRDRYRLRPDRRFLAALALVARPAEGEAPLVQALHQEGRWKILVGGEEAGLLAEFPDFEEATELLARRVSPAADPIPAAAPIAPAVAGAIEAVDPEALAAALGAPDLGRRSFTVGLAWLATLTTDSLEQADPLLAAAWAALAADREPRAEALLARALGYGRAAALAAGRLADDDPVRLYAAGDEPGLAALCSRRQEDRPCRFLHLALLADRGRGERFASVLAASRPGIADGPALAGLRIRLADFDYGKPGRELAEQALRSLGLATGPPSVGPEFRSGEFEAAVEQLAAPPAGATLAALQSWHRANYYSGLYNQARFALDLRASAEDAARLADSLTPAAPGTAEELRRYLAVRAAVLGGSRDMSPVAGLLAAAPSIGAPPLHALARSIARQVTTTDRLRRQPIPAFFERLDTRPAHRLIAARVARENLTSPFLHEKLARAAAAAAPHLSEELPALVAELDEDAAGLRLIAGDSAMPLYAQVVALVALSRLGQADDAFVRARYEAFAADPDGSSQWLLDFLESRGDRLGAIAAVDAALARRGHPLTLAYLRGKKAQLQLAIGRPEAAFATIRPALSSGKEDVLLQAAAIELARRRPQSALKLAQESLGRYPAGAAEAAGLIAQARWQLGDGATAARELAANPGGILGAWVGSLPAAFADSFAAAPEEEVRKAFGQLIEAGIPHRVLGWAAIGLGEKRDHRLAVSLLGQLSEPAPEWRDQLRLQTYDLLRAKAGAAEALAYIRGDLPAESHNFALTLYQMRRYGLLLDLFADGREGESPHIVRLLKAAAFLHLGETRGPRWEEFLAAVRAEPKNDFSPLTRILVDPGDGMDQLAKLGGRDRATLGWLFGVKAASAGRFALADGFFQAALESGLEGQPPHAWAWVIESDWIEARRSLELLEKRRAFQPGAAAAAAPEASAGLAEP